MASIDQPPPLTLAKGTEMIFPHPNDNRQYVNYKH